ncbi:MAG: hypothetical protein Q9210_001806 [Variospora velana]
MQREEENLGQRKTISYPNSGNSHNRDKVYISESGRLCLIEGEIWAQGTSMLNRYLPGKTGYVQKMPTDSIGLVAKLYRLLKLPIWLLALHVDLCVWISRIPTAWVGRMMKAVREFRDHLWWEYHFDTQWPAPEEEDPIGETEPKWYMK